MIVSCRDFPATPALSLGSAISLDSCCAGAGRGVPGSNGWVRGKNTGEIMKKHKVFSNQKFKVADLNDKN